MDKAKGTPLRDVWYPMSREEKHKLVENVVLLEASLVEHRFESVGGIYYERDLGDVQDVKETKYNGFIIGPSTPRTFLEDGTRDVESDRGPCMVFFFSFLFFLFHGLLLIMCLLQGTRHSSTYSP